MRAELNPGGPAGAAKAVPPWRGSSPDLRSDTDRATEPNLTLARTGSRRAPLKPGLY